MFKASLKNTLKSLRDVAYIWGTSPHLKTVVILYNNNHHPFRGCKHGGRSKNVSNNFDPFVFFPDGEGYMYVRPLLSKTRAPEDLHLGGLKVCKRYVTPYPPPNPAPLFSTDRGMGGGKNCSMSASSL